MNYLELNVEKDDRDGFLDAFGDSALTRAVAVVPDKYKLMSEQDLAMEFEPKATDHGLKKNFWEMFIKFCDGGLDKPKQSMIYSGVCSSQHFLANFITNPARVAWLVTPPMHSYGLIEEAFHIAYKKFRDELLTMKVTEKTAPVLFRAFQYLADRKMGPMVHKIESRNLHLGIGMDGARDATPKTPEEIDAKLAEIRAKLIPANIKDVESDTD